MLMKSLLSKIWDKLGICVSGLCLVHCLATPLVLFFFPTTNLLFKDETVHQIFAVLVVTSVLFAVLPNCKKHGHKDILVYASAGVTFILLGIFLHEQSEAFTHIATVLGSVLLIWAHFKNMRVRHGKCDDLSIDSAHKHCEH